MEKIRTIVRTIERVLRGPTLLVLMFLVVYAGIVAPFIIQGQKDPESIQYGFPSGYGMDYFQYIYEIRNGQRGEFIFRNVYTTDPSPIMILEPHYNLLGFLSKPFNISPFQVYLIGRLFAQGLLIFMIFILISRASQNGWIRLAMAVMVIFSTSVWHVTANGQISDPITYSNFFNLFTKLISTQLHHFLATALIIIFLLHLIRPSLKRSSLILTAGITVIFGFLHLYDAVFVTAIWGLHFIISSILKRKIDRPLLLHLLVIVVVLAPITLYYIHLLMYVWQNTLDITGQLVYAPRYVTLAAYLTALGPVLVVAVPALFIPDIYKQPLKRLVMLWAFVPIGLFLLPDIHIPTSSVRVFQLFQQIPLGITAGLVVEEASRRIHFSPAFLVTVVSIAFLTYGIPNYLIQLRWYTSPEQPYFGWYRLIQVMKPALTYLKSHTPPDSAVLATERTSLLIPDFTENRIVVGHPGTNPNYGSKVDDMEAFLGGFVSENQVFPMIKKYHISYIIFGAESPPFDSLPYRFMPYFTEVFHDGDISVVKVL